MRTGPLSWAYLALLLAGCAAPSLKLYTLGAPAVDVGTDSKAADAPAVEVRRVTLPDYLDTQDILTRRGSTIVRSSTGRWASRLSLGATDLITTRLAAGRPDLFVTDQSVIGPVSFRVVVNISRLDVSADGRAALAADWTIEPHDERQPNFRDRASFELEGPAKTDADVVTLTNALLDRLAARIGVDLGRLAPQGYE